MNFLGSYTPTRYSALMASAAPKRIHLPVGGMHCASCVARVEGALEQLDGVEASVNLATETASVRYDPARVSRRDLARAVESAGYEVVEHEHPDEDLGRRVLVAALLSAPLVALMAPGLRFAGWEWVELVLATVVVFWAGLPIHRATLRAARHRATTMDTLISLGTLAAWGWSVVALLAGSGELYFEVAAVVTTLVLLGRYLETRARRRAGGALRALLELGAKDARVLRDGAEVGVPAEDVVVGDLLVVRPGEKLAADGVVVEGESAVDASLLTGEPVPVDVGPGDELAGGSVNTWGRLVVRATRVGADTALAQIGRLVAEAQAGKAPVQRLVDRISAVFVPAVVVLSLATLAGWLLATGDAADAFTAAVAVLVVACPCALGLATPAALAVGTGRGAQLGIVIRGPEILERTRRVTSVVLDKTGTLTEGALRLEAIEPLNGATRGEILRLAGAVEAASEHPVGRAVATAARAELGELPAVEGFVARPGAGATGRVEGFDVEIGSENGATVVRWDGAPRGRLRFADALKPTSAEAVTGLRALGLDPVLLTGDAEAEARRVAAEAGIDRVLAGVRPEGKAAEVARLQEAGETVAMVGDGVNDAPALAQADLGVALGTGADVAIEAADLTLVSGDLRAAVDAIRLSRRTLSTIKGNLFWAFAYNVAAIPLAVAGLLNPMIAAAAMAASSLFVVGNSLRLTRFRSVRA